MGAWGIGPFENDTACDWLADHHFETLDDAGARKAVGAVVKQALRIARPGRRMAPRAKHDGLLRSRPLGSKTGRFRWWGVEELVAALAIAAGRGFHLSAASVVKCMDLVDSTDGECGWRDDVESLRTKCMRALRAALLSHGPKRSRALRTMRACSEAQRRVRRKRMATWRRKHVRKRRRKVG